MTDTRLQSLRRERAASGDPGAEVRLLVARLRTAPGCFCILGHDPNRGDYPGSTCGKCAGTGSPLRARVELAAYCGSEVAAEVLDPGVRFATPDGRALRGALDFPTWIDNLARRWADVGPVPGWLLVRASVAAARVALRAEFDRRVQLEARPQGLLTHAWDGQPIPSAWDALTDTGRARLMERAAPDLLPARRAIEAAEAWLDDPTEERREAWGVAMTGEPHRDWLPWPPFSPSSVGSRERDWIGYQGRIDGAARLAGEQPVREAICRSLVEWALSEDA